jgi:hypothetical protein
MSPGALQGEVLNVPWASPRKGFQCPMGLSRNTRLVVIKGPFLIGPSDSSTHYVSKLLLEPQ